MRLPELLRATIDRQPDRPALTDVASGRTLTYAELGAQMDAVAATLRSAGVGTATRTALVGSNSFAYVGVAFGILAAGGCVVPIAANLRAAERDRILDDIAVQAVVRVPEDGTPWTVSSQGGFSPPSPRGTAARSLIPRLARRSAARSARGVRVLGQPPNAPDRDWTSFAALDPAFVRFSSGTTADAKGVVLSHATTLARIAAADAVLRLGPDDRVLWILPLAYHFAVTIPAYLGAGAHILLCPETQPLKVATALAHHAATVLYASPILLERLAAVATPPAVPALRLALSTAAPLRTEVAERFAAAYDHPLGQAYGIIEAGLPCINTGHDAGVAATAVGRAVPGYEITIMAENEVAVRGPGLFDAYFTPWTHRTAATRDGWFMTGDVGSLDAAGVLTLHGRRKSTIVVAGLKFFPEEVEEVLATFPAIAEARVFARAHPRLGELPHAEVVLHAGADLDRAALAAHCARELSPYKVPVTVTVVTTLAKTAGGKLLRR